MLPPVKPMYCLIYTIRLCSKLANFVTTDSKYISTKPSCTSPTINDVVPATLPACATCAIANLGYTIHLLGPQSPCTDKRRTNHGITVGLLNVDQINSTHTALLTFLQLHVASRQAHVLPDLHNQALLSIGQFCDHGFQVHFNKTVMHLANSDTTIYGSRKPSNGLYYIELNPQYLYPTSEPGTVTHAAYSAYSMTTKRDIVQYLHRADFSPVVRTWKK